MATPPFLTPDAIDGQVTWPRVVQALNDGHGAEPAQVGDLLLRDDARSLLNRAAWIPGLGIGLKTVSVFPENAEQSPPRPTVQGVFVLYDDATGAIRAFVDGGLITRWKTAADSVLGARYLARPESRTLLIAGSGSVGRELVAAYKAVFPELATIRIWSRTHANADALAQDMAAQGYPTEAVTDLASAAGKADIIASATLASEPILHGAWLRPGTHVDLIGAYRPDMREADDALLRRAEIFVDSRETTLEHIGELKIPLEAGTITRADVRGDLYDLHAQRAGRSAATAITLFKNGGGAHLDLMVADLFVRLYEEGAATGG